MRGQPALSTGISTDSSISHLGRIRFQKIRQTIRIAFLFMRRCFPGLYQRLLQLAEHDPLGNSRVVDALCIVQTRQSGAQRSHLCARDAVGQLSDWSQRRLSRASGPEHVPIYAREARKNAVFARFLEGLKVCG